MIMNVWNNSGWHHDRSNCFNQKGSQTGIVHKFNFELITLHPSYCICLRNPERLLFFYCFKQDHIDRVRDCLPEGDFEPMIRMLRKFLGFMNFTVSNSVQPIAFVHLCITFFRSSGKNENKEIKEKILLYVVITFKEGSQQPFIVFVYFFGYIFVVVVNGYFVFVSYFDTYQ